jgi:hypothetical protein
VEDWRRPGHQSPGHDCRGGGWGVVAEAAEVGAEVGGRAEAGV